MCPDVPSHAGPLGDLAATIGEQLRADGVLLATVSPDGTPTAAGTQGLPARGVAALLAALERMDAFGGREMPTVAPLGALDGTGAASLEEAGFPCVLCVPVELGEERLGMLFGVFRRFARPVDDLLLPLARHAAVALAQERRRGLSAWVPQMLDLHDEFDRFPLSTTSDEDLTRRLAETLGTIFGVPMVALMIYDDERDMLYMAPGSFGASDERVASYQISVLDSHSNSARVFTTGQPYLSDDARTDPGIRPRYVQAFGIDRVLSIPLRAGDHRIGVLHLANKREPFTVDDLVRAEALAPRVATVVDLARTSLRLRRERRLEGVLSTLALGIAGGRSLGTVLPPALAELAEVTGASVVALVPDDCRPVVHRMADANPRLERALLEAAGAHAGTRAEVVMPEGIHDPGWAGFHVPLELEGARIGALSALRERGVPFAADERRALTRVGQLATLAWATERYQQHAAQAARIQERCNVSSELHDEVEQLLVEAQTRLDGALRAPSIDGISSTGVRHARRLVIRGFTAVHSVTQLARPAASDLPLRLRAALASIEQEFALPVRLELTHAAAERARQVPIAAGDVLVKVAREALVNAAKHGGRCRAIVRLECDSDAGLELTIVDDGVGLGERPADRRHGLASLRRALALEGGRLRIGIGPAGGTTVVATVPLAG